MTSRPNPAGATDVPSRLPLVVRLLDALLTVLVAPPCLACGRVLEAPSRGPVCEACWSSIPRLTPPLCDRCGEPLVFGLSIAAAAPAAVTAVGRSSDLGTGVGRSSSFAAAGTSFGQVGGPPLLPESLCPRCRRVHSPITAGRSAGAYDGVLRRLVHALKYERRRSLSRALSRLMRERGSEVLDGAAVAVPVPLHWRRRLARGFNQSDDLARGLGLPVCRALRRSRATRPQFGLRPGARRRNLAGAFSPCRDRPWRRWRTGRTLSPLAIRGACVVLVDDVTTTGATLTECAEVLVQMGAREVRTLTAARALR